MQSKLSPFLSRGGAVLALAMGLAVAAPSARAAGPITGLAGKCLDARGGSSANGTEAILWSCHGGANQRWRWHDDEGHFHSGPIVGVGGKCLDAGRGEGAVVTLQRCNGSRQQQWSWRDPAIVSIASGMCLDVPQSDSRDGNALIMWRCTRNANQSWVVYD